MSLIQGRYHDPATQQFISRDPLEGVTNQPYTYAGDNRGNFIDRTGMAPEKPWPTMPMWGEGEMPIVVLAEEFGPLGLAAGLAAEAIGGGEAAGAGVGLGADWALGGANLTKRGDEFGKFASKARRVPGYTDVVIHGSPTEFATTRGGAELNHRTVARMLRNNPDYAGGPIRLLSCSVGTLGASAAQNLVNKLGVEVMAPSDLIWADQFGNLIIGPSPFAPTGGWRISSLGVRP